MAIAAVCCIVFAGVAIHELDYASGHPYAYGPAKVIAWGAFAGAALALAVLMVGLVVVRSDGR